MMNERDEHRIATRRRQGLYWLPNTPGWDHVLDTLSETVERHGPAEWVVTFLDETVNVSPDVTGEASHKQGGMHWTVAGAIIALRCAVESNRFDDFWERRAGAQS